MLTIIVLGGTWAAYHFGLVSKDGAMAFGAAVIVLKVITVIL